MADEYFYGTYEYWMDVSVVECVYYYAGRCNYRDMSCWK